MKKMVLVPEAILDTIVRRDDATSTPEMDAVIRFGREMEKLRERRDINLNEKMRLFKEAQRQYLHFRNELAEREKPRGETVMVVEHEPVPPKTSRTTTENVEEGHEDAADRDVLATLPESYISAGKRLLNTLRETLSYDKKTKEIIFRGNRVPGSNIRDLVYDTVAKHRGGPPIGLHQFQQAMTEAKVPENLKRNTNRYPKVRSGQEEQQQQSAETQQKTKRKKTAMPTTSARRQYAPTLEEEDEFATGEEEADDDEEDVQSPWLHF